MSGLQTLVKPVRDWFSLTGSTEAAFRFPLQRTFGRKRNPNQRGSFKDGTLANV